MGLLFKAWEPQPGHRWSASLGGQGGNNPRAISTPSMPSDCSTLFFKLHLHIVLIFKQQKEHLTFKVGMARHR